MAETEKLWNFSQKEGEEEYLYAYDKMERDRVSSEEHVYKVGVEDGFKKGQQEGVEEAILKFLDSGVEIERISEVTGFSKEKIYEFKEKAKQQILYKNFKSQDIDITREVENYRDISQKEIESEYLHILEKKKKNRVNREKLIHTEGFEEGVIKGLHKERENVALNMLKNGVDTQIILDVTKFTKDALEGLKRLEDLREAMKGRNIARTGKKFWNLSQDEVLIEYLEAIDKQERDRISAENLARREGQQEGIEKEIEKGIEKECREIALNMLKSGVDIQVILDSTKLSREELEKLKEI